MTTVEKPADQRRRDRTPTATYIRIPHADHKSGKTIAYAILRRPDQTRPAQWEVRVVGNREPAGSYSRREVAEDRLDALTEHARSPRW